MSLFSMLLGKKKNIKCIKCKQEGIMFLENGAHEGQFRVIGKDEDAWLILQCKSCSAKYKYDSFLGRVKYYDELKEIAKNDFGIDIKD